MKITGKFLFAFLLITSCSPSPKVIATQTAGAWTPTPKATATPAPVKFLLNFDVKRVPVGTHGNMACMTYQGATSDLSQIILHATFRQEDKILQKNVELEKIDGQMCFEMIDFVYKEGNVQLILEVNNSGNQEIKISEDNKVQIYDLGEYTIVSSLSWLFGNNGIDRNVGGGFRNGHRQWDLAYSSDAYPKSVGTPIYAPSYGYIVNYTDTVPGRNGTITNLQAYLPQLGIIFSIGHINPENHLDVGEYFNAGEIIAVIDSNQPGSSRPHTHLGISSTEIPPHGGPWGAANEDYWLNPFSNDPLSFGHNLPTGLWLPQFLPHEIKDLFSQEYFKNNTFIQYEPLLSTN